MLDGTFVDFDVRDRILIVGSGAAGLAAAYEFRRLGFAGELVVMGDEPEGHYDRPACSKGILTGHKRPSDVITPLDPDLDVVWRLGRRAVACDLNRRVVEAHTGEMIYFDGLVIASGCRPVVPNDWPDDQPGMHVLHGLPAAWELRRELRTARRVAVVGGGVTGCEVACAVRELAREAVIIEPRPFVMGRAVGSVIGHMVAASHRRAGIELATGGRVSDVDVRHGRWHLTLKDGSSVDADLVVAAMGERPDVGWLEGTGIDISDGVLCDESLRAMTTGGSAVEGVVACGSLARWPNPRGTGKPARCGQWIAAQEQGQGAARTLLAGGRPVPAVSILPRYWSHQQALRIEVCGELDPDAEVDVEEMRPGKKDVAKAGVIATYKRDGKIVGISSVNAPRAFTNMARMLRLDEPQVTVIPALPAPVSPGMGALPAAPARLELPAGPSAAPSQELVYAGPDPMYGPPYGHPSGPPYGPPYGHPSGPPYGPGYAYGYGYDPEPSAYDPGYGAEQVYGARYSGPPFQHYGPGQYEQAAREQAMREQAAREQALREQAAQAQALQEQAAQAQAQYEQAMREQAAQEQAMREQAAHEQARWEQAAQAQAQYEQAMREQAQALRDQAAQAQAQYEQAMREQAAQEQAMRERAARAQAQYEHAQYAQAQYQQAQYQQAQYQQAQYEQAQYEQAQYQQAQSEQAQYQRAAQAQYEQAAQAQAQYEQAQYEQAQYAMEQYPGGYQPGYDPAYDQVPVPTPPMHNPRYNSTNPYWQPPLLEYGKTRGYGPPPATSQDPRAGTGLGISSGPAYGAGSWQQRLANVG